MFHRLFHSLKILALAVFLGCLACVSIDGQAGANVERTGEWEPPLTPHGVPDLEGVRVNNSATPLERPPELERKSTLTDVEVANLQERADRLFANGTSDFPQTDDVFLAALRNVERYENPRGTGQLLLPCAEDLRESDILDHRPIGWESSSADG